ncbi:MAG TPA: EB domain-containing protein [Polyangiaceae bacterium LLY-WYZ-14_1]|nr:EB domain-containing protein [Polyangiaceae bacterium LLY-WYZ-14_1]
MGALFLSSCGDDDLACGEGTVEMDGACVPASMVTCAPGTVLVDGRCVFDADNCAEGTSFDEAAGGCVADVTECAPGTVAMGRTCVPDGSIICADNTTFDPDTGTCVVTSEACAEGTTLVDGVCVPDDETLVAEVAAAAEPDDPFLAGGTPGSFIPPGIGEERTLDGCITPADFDGDGEIDIDFDVFDFTVDGPGLYRIRADGLRGLAAGFAVVTKESLPFGARYRRGGFGARGFARLGLNLAGDTSQRRVFLPGAGTYQLAVFDSRSIDLANTGAHVHRFTRPVGSEDTCYFVTVERELLPEPSSISFGEAVRGEVGDPVFFRTSVAERSLVSSALELAGGFDPAQPPTFPSLVFVTEDEFTATDGYGERPYSPVIPAGEGILVAVDAQFSFALAPVDFVLELTALPLVPEDGVLTAVQPEPGTIFSLFTNGQIAWFEADAGDVVRVSFAADFTALVSVSEVFRGFSVDAPCGPFGCLEDVIFYRVPSSGTQLVDVGNPAAEGGAEFDVSFMREARTPVSLGPGVATTVPLVGERTFVDVDPGNSPWTVVQLSAFAGTGFTAADVGFHEESTVALADPPALFRDGISSEVSLIQGRSGGRPVLVELRDPSGFDGDESVNVRFGSETFFDLRVDPTAPVSRIDDAVPAGGAAYYFVRAVPDGEVTFEATGDAGTDPVVQQLDELTAVVADADLTGSGGTETLTATVGEPGWLAFAVRAGTAGGSVDVSVTQAPLPAFTYTQRPGTTSFTSICPSAGGDGERLVDGESVLGARSLSTLSGFELFGEPVTELQVSTSGWLTVDEDYEGGAFLRDSAFNQPRPPFSVIGALINNDIEAEVCVLEESGRLVVEWRGTAGSATDTVEMQAVLRAEGDTVELVYGSGHEATAGIVGLKSPDGLTRARSVLRVRPETSILFTPLP